MVEYWLGPKWDGIDDNNPARIAYIMALQCELHKLGFEINEDSFLSAAKGVYDEEIISTR